MSNSSTVEHTNAIAIIGMACRLPGARNVEEFWQNLRAGVESVTFFSDEELVAAGVDPLVVTARNYVKAGAVLEDIDLFDAAFFGFTPREAEMMDPQQRIFLECSWQALEDAGYTPDSYQGKIGLYAGVGINTYISTEQYRVASAADLFQIAIGNEKEHLATHTSYKLNLTGPSISVSTACSTSLVAVHMACQSLLNHEGDIFLAGGVSIKAAQKVGYFYQEEGIASPDGHCRAFDARALGTIPGNGAGVVVLKRLDAALADGDTIHAIIKGSAINNDGSLKVGYTAPSVQGQAEVIAEAQAVADVEPEEISYIEGHGTGTPLGDTIEITALNKVFRAQTQKKGFCAIGSVKTNLGHLDTASGVTSLIKTVLALKHRLLPPSLHFEQSDPAIELANSPFYVNTALTEWKGGSGPRRAGVSSFGLGGTNVHLILEEAPVEERRVASRPWQLLAFSGRTATSLDMTAGNLVEHLKRHPHLDLADVAYTLQVGRKSFGHRRVIVCRDCRDAVSVLESADPTRTLSAFQEGSRRALAFLLPGVGDHYVQMAWGLYRSEPIFRQHLDRCAELLKAHLGLDLRDVLYPDAWRLPEKYQETDEAPASLSQKPDLRKMLFRDEPDAMTQLLNETRLTQPAVFVIEYALARLWMEWLGKPEAMIGYSLGEYVAACLAGVLSLEDALSLVASRAQMIHVLPAGAMLAVPLPEQEVQVLLGERCSIAAVNTPSLCVVAGPVPDIDALESELLKKDVDCRRLQTSHAFHSNMMLPIVDRFVALLKGIKLRAPTIPYLSNVTGTWITPAQATDPQYWARHLCQTVRFADGIDELFARANPVLLEVGPGQSLGSLAIQNAEPANRAGRTILSSLRYKFDHQSDMAFLLNTLGRLWLAGAQVHWPRLHAGEQLLHIPLPTYPFERQRYWIEPQRQATKSPAVQKSQAKRSDVTDWFYLPSWKHFPLHSPLKSLTMQKQCWLIFVDEWGIGSQIAKYLEEEQQDVVTVIAGNAFNRLDDIQYTLNPRARSEYEVLIQDLQAIGRIPEVIVHCWSITTLQAHAHPDIERFTEAQHHGFYSLLFLAQALGKYTITDPLQIRVVSNHIQDLERGDWLDPVKATLLGPCKVIPQEYTTITCQCIDVALPEMGNQEVMHVVQQLIEELHAPLRDPVIAYRGKHRWVQTFETLPLENKGDATRLRPKGVYLIVGGLGAIGFYLARGLVQSVQARLILTGRSELPPRTQWQEWLTTHERNDRVSIRIRRVQELEEMGADVLVMGADATDVVQMQAVMDRAQRRFGTVNGVIYAAGVESDKNLWSIQGLESSACELHFQPKVYGSLVLEEVLSGRTIDFCLLLSSLSSVLGGLQFTPYASANIFLDAYTHYHNQVDPIPWISVDWDGVATPAETVDAMLRILSLKTVEQVVVSTGDLYARLDQWIALTALREGESDEKAAQDQTTAHYPRPNLSNSYVSPRNALEQVIADIWQSLMGIAQVGIHDNFFALGGHSLLATRIVTQLRKAIQIELPLRTFLETPTVAELAEAVTALRIEQAQTGQQAPSVPPLVAIVRTQALPLSFAQQRLWFLDQLEPGNTAYTILMAVQFKGALVTQALERSLETIVQRHEILRTTFHMRNMEAVQSIGPAYRVHGSVVDLSGLQPERREEETAILRLQQARRPFDLAQGPLLRMMLLRLDQREHLMLLPIHHILTDGWSNDILFQELRSLYNADVSGQPSSLPELPVQYADFAVWQRQWLQGEVLQTQLDYWTRQLRTITSLELPTDYPRPAIQTFHGAHQFVFLQSSLNNELRLLSQRENVTLFMTLLAAFQVLLARYSGQSDLSVGTSIANRTRSETEGLMGFFVNTLVLRTDLSGNPTFQQVLARVQEVCRGAYAHQDLPFEKLVEVLQPERDASRSPLFQVMFALQNTPRWVDGWQDLTLDIVLSESATAKFDLSLSLTEVEQGLHCGIEYNTDLFEASTIHRLIAHFRILLEGIVAHPEHHIDAIPLIRAEDLRGLESLSLTARSREKKAQQTSVPAVSVFESGTLFVEARTPIEELLAGVWCELLQRSRISIYENFFALGGHSLLATQIIARLRMLTGVELPLRSLFEFPTIAGLAECVEQIAQSDDEDLVPPPPLVPVPRTPEMSLSFAQQRLWFLYQLEPQGTAYLELHALYLHGTLRFEILERCMQTLVQRHESLRTTFHARDGRPVQVIHPHVTFQVPLFDLQALSADEQQYELHRLFKQESQQPYDLSVGPLLRMCLLRLDEHVHFLLLTLHHIVSDGWSMLVMQNELIALYQAFVARKPSPLKPLPIQYVDFALWQRQWLQGRVLETQLTYWRQRLADSVPLELPTDYPRRAEQSYRGARQSSDLPAMLSEELSALSRREGVTLFMLLLAAFQVLLARYSGQSDISVGTPIANRTRAELEGQIGFLVNTLILRSDLSGNPCFSDVLKQVREVALGAYAHQDVPFEQLVEALQPERDLSRSPLFQVMFILHNAHGPLEPLPDLMFTMVPNESVTAKFDLTLAVIEMEHHLRCEVEYCTDLFTASTIGRFLEHFQILLEGIVACPTVPLVQLPLLSVADQQQLLVEWNATRTPYPDASGLHELIEAQVERSPDAIALWADEHALSYRELNNRANRLAYFLRHLNVGPESVVGVLLERSLWLSISLLAILKAGGAYLPLDSSFPSERLGFMLRQSRASLLLSIQKREAQALTIAAEMPDGREQPCQVIALDRAWWQGWCGLEAEAIAPLSEQPVGNPERGASGENAAYVIYTSGSTGEPKGVINTHRGIVNRLWWMQERYQLWQEDRVLQKTPTSFDVSVWELFWPLLAGAQLVLARPGGQRESGYLLQVIEEQAISTLHFVPSMLEVFLEEPVTEEGCRSVRQVICSGEVLTVQGQQRFFERMGARLYNLYGPTEAAIDVSSWECERGSQPVSVPIGRAISNIELYILDARQRPVPIGVAGELYIGGSGLARGYGGRADLTAERFVPHPYAGAGERLYRTGDRVKYREDGAIDYLGRLDQQVKLRGYRIELGEIEARLRQQPAVRECVVLIREDNPGVRRLVAYIVPTDPALLPLEELRAALRQQLPEYMLPSVFVALDALPLTGSGKIDRRALPAPDIALTPPGQEIVAPRTEIETRLAGVWCQVLGIEGMSVHENFFALGGDSILSLQVVVRARQAGLQMTPKLLFQHPTIAGLATAIAQAQKETATSTEQELFNGEVPLTPIQHWFFSQQPGQPQHFNQAVLLRIHRPLNLRLLTRTLYHLGSQHDALRFCFSQQDERDWQQVQTEPAAFAVLLDVISLTGLAEDERQTALATAIADIQASLKLQSGPLMRAGYFELGVQQPARLLLVIHHLVVDGVSWRILLEDLWRIYEQLERGDAVQLAAKTASFQHWARSLQVYAQQEQLREEMSYWLRMVPDIGVSLPVDEVWGENTVGSSRVISSTLDQDETRLLLYRVPQAYHTQINDILLTAFAQTLADWTGEKGVMFHLEGHGRHSFHADIDLSRTVGWFTSLYPVWLEVYPEGPRTALSTQIKLIKEQLRQIPQQGIGYGLLRYLCQDAQVVEQMRAFPQPQAIFNYLGQLDQTFTEQTLFDLAPEASGPTRDPAQKRPHLLEVSGGIIEGRLRLNWTYSQHIHRDQTIEALVERYQQNLRMLIAHCCSAGAGGYTPSDFPLASLKQQQLDALLEPRAAVEDIYPLSPLQEGLLFHTLYYAASGVYVMQLTWRFAGSLRLAAFEQAWQQAIARHSVLRTAFVWDGESRFVQVVEQRAQMPVQILDWRGLSLQEQEEQRVALLQTDRTRGFALEKAPLMRLVAIYEADNRIAMLWSHHHLLLDGWSLPRLFDDVLSTYRYLSEGQHLTPKSYRPYRDYIDWLQGQDVAQAEQFWRHYLAGFTSPTRLSADHLTVNTGGVAARVAEVFGRMDPEVTARLRELARELHLTLNTVLQGTWAILLNRYSGERDVVFGTTVAGRPAALNDVETMVGLFINTLPVRVQIEPQAAFWEWLLRLQEQQLEARQYEYAPLVKIQAWSEVPQGQPLFESLLIFENYPVEASLGVYLRELEIQDVRVIEQTNYPLTLRVSLQAETLAVSGSYDPAHFEAATVQRLLNHWWTLLESIVADPAVRVAQASLLSVAEQQQLLVEWNATRVDYPTDRCLPELFEAQVEYTPDGIALIYEEQYLSYEQLNRRANQVARFLHQHTVGADTLVGICMERSLEMVVGMLGVLKAGGAYVPLDPFYPEERLAFVLQDAKIDLLLTQEHLLDRLPAGVRPVCLDTAWQRWFAGEETRNLSGVIYPEQLAYTIYTSGSTGKPKGVMISHRNVMNFFAGMDRYLGDEIPGTWLAVTSISFDISVLELFWTLVRGYQVVIQASAEVAASRRHPSEAVETYQVSHLQCTPSFLRMFLSIPEMAHALRGLRTILSGGEALPASLVKDVREYTSARILNMYGPTETTIWSTAQELGNEDMSVPIGRPIANTQIYVLDQEQQPVAVGVSGEIWIGGIGIARGYLHHPEWTAERFIPDRWSDGPGGRLYRTGDVGRYRADGKLEYLGRSDAQIKLRGYRIELGEIEAVLNEHPAVNQSVVVLQGKELEEKQLVACVVSEPEENLLIQGPGGLRAFLLGKLPEQMVPAHFVLLEKLPLTPNGKIDRNQLPPTGWDREGPQEEEESKEPGDQIEELILQIWREVLRRERIWRQANFFELGGHSLLAMQITARMKKIFQIEIPVRSIFEAPTVAALAVYIEQQLRGGQKVDVPVLEVRERPDLLPLSFAQQRLWFLDQLEPGSPAYLIPAARSVSGHLKIAALERSLQALVRRHESLRTVFQVQADQPVQVIMPAGHVHLPLIDLQGLLPEEKEQQAQLLAKQEAQQPCDLVHGPLLRSYLQRLQAQEHILLLTLHHIIADGWSQEIVSQELKELYQAFGAEQHPSLMPLPIQYADFALWQRQWLRDRLLERQLLYWRQQLADSVPLELPTDHPRPSVRSNRGAMQSVSFPSELYEQLTLLSHQEGVTLFMLLFAAFVVLLTRYSGQRDISVGTPIANRTQPELERLIGFFVNTLVLRVDVADNPRFVDLLGRVREIALGAYTHQDVPFEYLAEQLQPERDLSRSLFFQVMFNLRNVPDEHFEKSEALIMREFAVPQVSAKFDLTWTILSSSQSALSVVEYSTDLFEAATIQRFLQHWQTLLQGLVAAPQTRLSALPLLPAAERQHLLYDWNPPAPALPVQEGELSLPALFEMRACQTPERIALVDGESQLTYGQLNRRANQLAHALRQQGVGVETLVGLALPRGLSLLIGLLGILKSGGAYVPLDPSYPQERLAFQVRDARLSLIVTAREYQSRFMETPESPVFVLLDLEGGAVVGWQEQECVGNPTRGPLQAQALAYVIYTSGSTGKPKGVLVTQANVVRLFQRTQSWFQWRDEEVWTQFHSSSFDFSVWEIWGALLYGGRLLLLSAESSRSPEEVYAQVKQQGVTVLNQTPSAFGQLQQVDERQADPCGLALRFIIFGGEALEMAAVRRWIGRHGDEEPRLVNMYGITETTVHVTAYTLRQAALSQQQTSVIGRPIEDLRLYVLDAGGELVPIGVAGELYVGGAGVARGYLGRGEVTAERFVPDPFGKEPGGRLYRTGDRVRYRADGTLEYLGRLDEQVKIRGYRIELGEIEAVVRLHPQVREAVVVPQGADMTEKRLVAYVVVREEQGQLTGQQVRHFVQEHVPEYMVPAAIVFLDALPLTPNGKVDYRALPSLTRLEPEPEGLVVLPRTAAEEVVATIWADALGITRVSVYDNFFDLGGHSLLATRVISRICEAFQADLPLRVLFESPTVESIVTALADIYGTRDIVDEIAQVFLEIEQMTEEEVEPNLSNL